MNGNDRKMGDEVVMDYGPIRSAGAKTARPDRSPEKQGRNALRPYRGKELRLID